MKRYRGKLRVVLVATLVGVCALVTTSSAMGIAGIGGTGTAVELKRMVNNSPDRYSVKAEAFSLQANTKARGYYDVNNWPDTYTIWFTDRYVWHYSSEVMKDGVQSIQFAAIN